MSQDLDLLSLHALELAKERQEHLSQRFRSAVRLRKVGEGKGLRLQQIRNAGDRHRVAVRPVAKLPHAGKIDGLLVMAPAELVASMISPAARQAQVWRGLAGLGDVAVGVSRA